MTEMDLSRKLCEVAESDGRYHPTAYKFIFDSLDYVIFSLGKHQQSQGDRHISVDQLLDGIKKYALEQFGPLSKVVFESWGLYDTADIGEVVFNLVDGGLLNKQDSDSKEDFLNGFDFEEAFEATYVPEISW